VAFTIQPSLLEKLIEHTGQIVYDVNTVTGQVSWAGDINFLTGFQAADIQQWRVKHWLRRIQEQDRAQVEKALNRARLDGTAYHLEYRFKKKDGAYVWLEDNGIFLADVTSRMIGAIRDISQRKVFESELLQYHDKLEQMVATRTAELVEINNRLKEEINQRCHIDAALKASEERYRRVFENTGTATFLLEPDMTISMANAKASELCGLPEHTLVGRYKIIDFTAPAYRDRIGLHLELYIQGDQKIPNTFECQMIDGQRQVRDAVAQVQWIPQTSQAVASFLDITDIKRVEQDRKKLAAVIEQSADSILITDMRGRIEYANQAFERLHGVERQNVVGDNIEAPFFSRQEHQFLKQMTYMVSGEDSWSGRIRTQHQDNRTIITDTTILPIFDDRGRAVNLVCIKKDVTREVQLEKQLQHSQKMEAIGTLAGGIAHDFNNILGGILGFTELSIHMASKTDERLQRNLRRILEGCERAKDLIHHILTFSRNNDEKNKPIEIQLVVKEALKLLRASIPATIEIRQHITAQHSVVYTTPTHIHQVIMNLCTNAAQAMGENGGELDVTLENIDLSPEACQSQHNVTPGPYVCLKVRDSGKGMDALTLNRIFEPYFTTKAPSGGTGLGLFVVHGIVKNMDGLILVESKLEKGSTFEIYLPRIIDQAKAPIPALNDPPRGKEKILVVDDEAFILEIMRELLETLGYDVDIAESGNKAIELLHQHPNKYDLVITDQVMPKMTGMQLFKKINSLRPGMPVILCTGLTMQAKGDQPEAEKTPTILFKPIQYDQLATTVRQELDGLKSHGPS
jgi:PAS domain S-box-containing protein